MDSQTCIHTQYTQLHAFICMHFKYTEYAWIIYIYTYAPFGDSVFNWRSGLLSSIIAKFINLYCFAYFQPLLFSWTQGTEHKKAHCLFEKFIRQQHFSFSVLHFLGYFLGTTWCLNATIFSLEMTLYMHGFLLQHTYPPPLPHEQLEMNLVPCFDRCNFKRLISFFMNDAMY